MVKVNLKARAEVMSHKIIKMGNETGRKVMVKVKASGSKAAGSEARATGHKVKVKVKREPVAR